MRCAVEFRWLYGYKLSARHQKGSRTSRAYKEEEKVKCVEEQLRTYMLAGIEPEELE